MRALKEALLSFFLAVLDSGYKALRAHALYFFPVQIYVLIFSIQFYTVREHFIDRKITAHIHTLFLADRQHLCGEIPAFKIVFASKEPRLSLISAKAEEREWAASSMELISRVRLLISPFSVPGKLL